MVNSLKNKNSFFDKVMATTLFEIFAVLYIAHKLLPVFGYYMPGIVYLGVFAVTFLFGLTISTKGDKLNFTLSMLPLFSFCLLHCIRYMFMGNFSSIPIYLYGELQIYLYGIIAVWYIVKNKPGRAKALFNFILICYAVTAVTTYIGCTIYPQASRVMATLSTTDALYQLYTKSNIGGFSFIYELVLVLPLIIYMVKSKKINRIIGIMFIGLIGLVIIQSEYTTALIMYVLSLLLFIIPRLNGKKIILTTAVMILFLLISASFLADVFDNLSETVESDIVSERFSYIADLLRGESASDVSDSGDRMELYAKSLSAFWNSGMLGSWNNAKVGGHSFIFDTMGFYGIIGIIALVAVYAVMYKVFIGKYKDRNYYAYLLYVYILGILMAVINPKTNLYIFICLIPLFAFVMDNKEKRGNSDEIVMGS